MGLIHNNIGLVYTKFSDVSEIIRIFNIWNKKHKKTVKKQLKKSVG